MPCWLDCELLGTDCEYVGADCEYDGVDCGYDGVDWSGVGIGTIGGRFSRSWGMSGGGIGGCPLISNAPLALLSRVAQPPLPRVAPMLHATWWLPAVQLGSEMVL